MKLAQWITAPFAQPRVKGRSVSKIAPLGSAERADELAAGASRVRVCSRTGHVTMIDGEWDVQISACDACRPVDLTAGLPVPTVADTDEYLLAWSMIDKGLGGARGLSSATRRLALDAMARLSESAPATVGDMILEAGSLGEGPLRSLVMTLVSVERAHRANLVNA